METRRVVITGMGALTPVGNNVPAFWEGLLAGKNGIGPVTRFDTAEYKAKLAAEVKGFDPETVLEKPEIRKTDRFVQYALAAAKEAMADSGIIGQVAPERLGVYFGSGIGGFETFDSEHTKLIEKGPRRVSPHFIPMMIANIAAGTIAIKYGATGPCLPVTTACATGTNAVGEAFRAVRYGYADAILAGGSEAAITPMGFAGFINCMALSTSEDPEAASIPFDKRRGGFVMGEGAGALLLEEYEHAKARGAKIYAEISGYGCTCDAYHVTAPHPEAEGGARAIRLAVEETGKTPDAAPGVHQRPRHQHPPQRQGGNRRHQEGLRRGRLPGAGQLHQIHDRPYARRGGGGGGHRGGAGSAGRRRAAHHRVQGAGSGLRPRLCAQPGPRGRAGHGAVGVPGFGGHNACVAFTKAE